MSCHRRHSHVVCSIFALLSAVSCGDAWTTDKFHWNFDGHPAVKPGDIRSNIGNQWQHVKSTVIQSAFVASLLGGAFFLPLGPAGAALGGDPVTVLDLVRPRNINPKSSSAGTDRTRVQPREVHRRCRFSLKRRVGRAQYCRV